MLERSELRRRVTRIRASCRDVPGLRLDTPSWREAVWQGLLSRGGIEVFQELGDVADGVPLADVLSRSRRVRSTCLEEPEDEPVWSFISSAPQEPRPDPNPVAGSPSVFAG